MKSFHACCNEFTNHDILHGSPEPFGCGRVGGPGHESLPEHLVARTNLDDQPAVAKSFGFASGFEPTAERTANVPTIVVTDADFESIEMTMLVTGSGARGRRR